jgi:hypothetical protein
VILVTPTEIHFLSEGKVSDSLNSTGNFLKGVPLVGNAVFMVFEGKYLRNYTL